METIWTPERVKEELPDIMVKIDGKIYPGKIYGRKNEFATVVANKRHEEFSWKTLARCLNQNTNPQF